MRDNFKQESVDPVHSDARPDNAQKQNIHRDGIEILDIKKVLDMQLCKVKREKISRSESCV